MSRLLTNSRRRPIRLEIGPEDEGRWLAKDEYLKARFRDDVGVVYEIIDGFLIVSPTPTPSHSYWVTLLHTALQRYADRHRAHQLTICFDAEVVIPNRAGPTRPIPDLAIYRDVDLSSAAEWDDLDPFLVIEVISGRRAKKDTVRNRHLYCTVPGIEEYWIIDPRENLLQPKLWALRRPTSSSDWQETAVTFGETYKTKVLPGFSLNLRRLAKR